MIKIGLTDTIKTELEEKHWEYFETNFLQEFRDITNNETDAFQKSVFTYLLDEVNGNDRLKSKLILGTIQDHKIIITYIESLVSNKLSNYDFEAWKHNLEQTRIKIPAYTSFKKPTLTLHINALKESGNFISEIKNVFDEAGRITKLTEAVQTGKNIRTKFKELSTIYKTNIESLGKLKLKLREKFEKIFDYDNFSSSDKVWGAYKLTQKLNVTTCPYCNRLFTHTHTSFAGKTRPALDHFIPKSEYPYLALSLYNLIPSCQICNSSFKGSIDFYKIEHVHPYEENFGDDARFITDLNPDEEGNYQLSLLSGTNPINNFELKLKILDTSPIKSKIENSNATFHIEELYKFHKDYVLEIIRKSVFYNGSKIDELLNDEIFGGLFESREELIQTIIGNYIEEQDLNKRILAKLTRDIWQEYGLKDIWKK